MLQKVDLSQQKNIFVIATIFVFGIGGLAIQFKYFEFSPVATALVAGVLMNLLVNIKRKKPQEEVEKDKNKTD